MKFRIFRVNSNSVADNVNNVKVNINTVNKNHTLNTKSVSMWGFFGKPLKNVRAIIGETDRSSIVLGYLQKAVNGLEDGESIMFSKTPTGEISATIIARGDETIELLGNSDNLVRYSNLETEFNSLKTSFNNLVTNYNALVASYNLHTHQVPAASAITPPPAPTPVTLPTPAAGSPGTPNTSTISNAKHEGLKTNSKSILP